MDNRLKLQTLLETFTPNVYFQPPSTITIKYPAIVYSLSGMDKDTANNKCYKINNSYTITVIDRSPISNIVNGVMSLDYCKFDRQFITDGLNHTVFKIYY